MKPTTRLPFLVACALAAPASAEVIYSNLQNLAIPQNNTGVYLNVITGSNADDAGWHINPTFGGINVYNNSAFQPLREANVGNATLSNIPTGGLISSASTHYATGMGVSSDHLGTTFTAGSEGYLGFSVVNGPDTNYGWMRVVFTGTGTPLIKDWAYNTNTSSGSIAAGNIIQSGSTYTLDSSTQSFTLGSAITGANAVIKTGANTAILNAANTYTGATTINAGTLALGATGSISDSSSIKVGAGATFDVSGVTGGWALGSGKSLGGDGTVVGNATFNDSSIFAWNLSVTNPTSTISATVADTLVVNGDLIDGGGPGGSVFKILLAGNQTFSDNFWTTNHAWSEVLTSVNMYDLATVFTSFSYENADGPIGGPSIGSFSINGSTLSYNFAAIPEPTSALAGLLLAAGLLRRRR